MAIDNVCAWPNLTLMPDGSVVATIFNRPYHGLDVGDVECWASRDGRLWEKRGSPAVHEGESNRVPQHQRYHMGAVRWVSEE